MTAFSRTTVELPYTPVKILFLTGLSDPRNCALSDVQFKFLKSLDVPESWKTYRNFPWNGGSKRSRTVPLWRASLHNGWQFLLASTPAYRWLAGRHWNAVLSSTAHLLVITGSCGLQIVNCLLSGNSRQATRVDTLAMAPVAWRPPRSNYRLLQGAHDYISRLFFCHVDHRLNRLQHMNYLLDHRIRELTEKWISDSISKY